jgi:hypothetical protein
MRQKQKPPDLEHDPEKWTPVFGNDHAQKDNLARRELSLASAVETGNSNGIARFQRYHHR